MPDRDPDTLFHHGYGNNGKQYKHDERGKIYNSKGYKTSETIYNENREETRRQNDEARKQFEKEQKKQSRQPNYQNSYSSHASSGPSFSLGGLLGGISGLFVGWLGLFAIVAILYVVFILIGFVKYHSGNIISSAGDVFRVIGQLLTMPFTAWFHLFGDLWYDIVLKIEVLFVIGIILYTIRKAINDSLYYIEPPNLVALIGLIILEVIRSFTAMEYGILLSIYNGICLFLPVMIILMILDKILERFQQY